jgi:serine/threonine protein kinase
VSKRRIVEKGHHLKIEHERQALERLGPLSPFIVDLIGSYQSSDHLFFILEYCPGGNLGELLSRHRLNGGGGFHENTVRFYMAEVLCALNHIHEYGVIYRDLKPGLLNVCPAHFFFFFCFFSGFPTDVSIKETVISFAYMNIFVGTLS